MELQSGPCQVSSGGIAKFVTQLLIIEIVNIIALSFIIIYYISL